MAAETFDLSELGTYKYGFAMPERYVYKARKGLSREIVEEISWLKGEPEWMREFRLRALEIFLAKPMPTWGADLSGINFDDIYYYIKPTDKKSRSWDEVPEEIRRTFELLGIPEAERKFLAGVGAQYECLSGEVRVYTARGPIPIRDVQPGDIVFSYEEESGRLIPARVRATAFKGEREVFEVRVGTRTIRATANHPFLVLEHERASNQQRGRYRLTWKYLYELKPGDLVAVARRLPVEFAVPEIEGALRPEFRQIAPALVGVKAGNGDPYRRAVHSAVLASHDVRARDNNSNEFIGFARIDAIIPAGVEPVYDIEVEGPHNFVAEGLIVHNSEVVYHNLQEHLRKLGVIFVDTDTAVREYPDLVREYFGTVVPPDDNKFAALNSAVWSGGSFIYVPPGVHVDLPLQAYFRINAQNVGQFERTLIIAEEGSFVHYVEGCTAPIYTTDSLHSAVVEIIVKPGARVRYTTIQNWSTNVYNLVTKRAVVYRDAVMEWVDCNLGSKVTMKYPSVYLMEPGARGEILSIAFAGRGQHQDAGGKAIHAAPHTRSRIISKSISKDGGRTSYRGLVRVYPGAEGSTVSVNCDALILDEISRSDTYPYMEIEEDNVTIGHEATVSKISDEQLFYLMSRGIPQEEAAAMIVTGFVEPLVKELPMEYAVEMNRLIRLQMSGSVG